MEQTFMTIHNLTPDANILFASESVVDILGYHPQQVQGKSCFDYFHPDEVPFARSVHSRGVLLDKAAVLHYARILASDGRWISCECCFTVVHDVLVACTSIYKRGEKSERRAIEAPQIRRLFSSSPRDPRYHMLEHLSPKFKMPPMEREPRAALILNRFTRTLTIMFATNAVASILGVLPEQIKDKSFYECIQENCLQDAIKCLESAKANDSIAYLRFWYRDPRREEDFDDEDEDEDDDEDSTPHSEDSDGGGAHVGSDMDLDEEPGNGVAVKSEDAFAMDAIIPANSSRPLPIATGGSAFQTTSPSQCVGEAAGPSRRRREHIPSFELEAVVSCTSDGLVVVLRKARPPIPTPHPPMLPTPFDFENGLFAAPWGQQPIRPYYPPEMLYTFQPPLLPQFMPLRESVKAAGGPPLEQLMKSIRDVAVFAWALVGINGNFAAYGRGLPRGEAQPPAGTLNWEQSGADAYVGGENQAIHHWPTADEGKKAASPPLGFGRPFLPDPSQAFGTGQAPHTDNHAYGQPPIWSRPQHQPPPQPQSQQLHQPGLLPTFEHHQLTPPHSTATTPALGQPGSRLPGISLDRWGSPAAGYGPNGLPVPVPVPVPTTSSPPVPTEPSQGYRYLWQ